MLKRICVSIFFAFILLPSSIYGITHTFSASLGLLNRNSYISQLSTLHTNGNWYAVNRENWEVDVGALGFAVDVAYEPTFDNNFFLRFATGIETTGDFKWAIDIGGGLKLDIKDGATLSIGLYFATVQTGGKFGIVPSSLGVVGDNPPDELSYYMGLFGFKGRIALDIPLTEKYTLGPFLSYAAYPHSAHDIVSELDTDLYINNLSQGLRLDGFQIGVQFTIRL